MMDGERRTIDELIARYDLEPSLRDLYVEGEFDKDIAERCIRGVGQVGRVVYHIDSVHLPPDLLLQQGLTDGNKQRVIALARALAPTHSGAEYKCLVDRDLDHWFGELECCPGLVWTKYCSIELYFFTNNALSDIVLDTAKSKISNLDQFVLSLSDTLRSLYAIRLSDRELGWTMKPVAVEKHIKTEGSRILFARSNYISRLLMRNGRSAQAPKFNSVLKRWEEAISGDCRSFARGHDFVDLLAWAIKRFRGAQELASSKVIERIFVLYAVEVQELLDLFA